MTYLYPELEDYIYQHCQEFQTEDEVMAIKTDRYRFNTEPRERLLYDEQQGWLSSDPRILDMIADGREALKKRIVERIWDQHKHELALNLCPLCGKITRSPKARQCRFCFHNWH